MCKYHYQKYSIDFEKTRRMHVNINICFGGEATSSIRHIDIMYRHTAGTHTEVTVNLKLNN